MSPTAFIFFLFLGGTLLAAILARLDRWQPGRVLLLSLTFGLFVFAGFRSLQINSDTRSYASYALHFQDATISENAEVADRLEWGFRALLRGLALLLPRGTEETYPRYVNLTIACLGGFFLCRALRPTGPKLGALLLIYLSSLFFVHQFAIIRLGLGTVLLLNYLVPTAEKRPARLRDWACLVAAGLLHNTLLILIVALFAWELVVRQSKNYKVEIALFAVLGLLAACVGVILSRLAPLFLSGYHLYVVTSNQGRALSPKAIVEAGFCVVLYVLHFRRARWSWDRRHVRWRIIFYLMVVSFLIEAVSGFTFVARFRILCYCLFLMQTVLISWGIDLRKRTTWVLLLATFASLAAQFLAISADADWQVREVPVNQSVL